MNNTKIFNQKEIDELFKQSSDKETLNLVGEGKEIWVFDNITNIRFNTIKITNVNCLIFNDCNMPERKYIHWDIEIKGNIQRINIINSHINWLKIEENIDFHDIEIKNSSMNHLCLSKCINTYSIKLINSCIDTFTIDRVHIFHGILLKNMNDINTLSIMDSVINNKATKSINELIDNKLLDEDKYDEINLQDIAKTKIIERNYIEELN